MTNVLIRFFDKPVVRSAIARATRTFLQSFLAVITAAPIVNIDVPTVKAAAAAGIAAVISLAQRALDNVGVSPIPPG